MNNNTGKFVKGDIVTWGGLKGEVTEVGSNCNYPVVVMWGDSTSECDSFTLDGRVKSNHTEPSLRLISRTRRTVRTPVRRWSILFRSEGKICLSSLHCSQEEKDALVASRKFSELEFVELVGSYEAEVE